MTIKAFAIAPGLSASPVQSATYTIQYSQVATPVIMPASGSYVTGTEISIMSGTPDAVIRYTTDGSTPGPASQVYSAPFVLPLGSWTVKAYATKSGQEDSSQTSAQYTISDPPDGLVVHFKNRGGWTNTPHIHYWDTVPAIADTEWPGTAMSDAGDGWYTIELSGVTSANIVFNSAGSPQTGNLFRDSEGWYFTDNVWYDSNPEGPQKPDITANPIPGTYISAQSVVLESTNGSGDIIYYTTDGSQPNTSSSIYSGPVSVASSMTLTAYAINVLDVVGDTFQFEYTIDPDADLVAPEITPSIEAGHSSDPISVYFSVSDNKSAAVTAYYTTDGSAATTSSPVYITGNAVSGLNGPTQTVSETRVYSFLVVDGAGHETRKTFRYHIGTFMAQRIDPRQESIYFLLTSRWFDGDSSNTVGDEWCSYTEERVTPGSANYVEDHGFTGPEDVTWRGDFKGLVEKMDYIKALGFTTIWITPIVQNRSPLSYHGYHAWDFTKEDARLVSPGYDFQRVIDEAHNRDMKICLDVVLNHSGRMGIKDFAEIKYATDPGLYPNPDSWTGFNYNETRFQNGQSQQFPGNWEFDGLTSPGSIDGEPLPPWARFGDIRPFTAADIAQYPNLATDRGQNGFLKYQWPSTQSYCQTIDGKPYSEPNSLDYNGYKNSSRRMRGHNTGFPTGSGSWDNFPDAHFDSCHEDCPDLNIENPDVQDYLLDAYYRYIDMGVDMFRVDTVMHMHKQTLNEMYWPQLLQRAESARDARGGGDFYMFGEVANFVGNPTDKASQLREQNYTWDDSINNGSSSNHWLDGNNYRAVDDSHKAPNASASGRFGVINMVAHNNFCNGHGGGYGAALGSDHLFQDATYNVWYADSHDYGPNKSEYRYSGDFAALWSMLFTFRGIPVVYYGSEIRFKQGHPNDWPGGGANGVNMSLEKTGRGYYGEKLSGTVTATGFGEYTASGNVSDTLDSELSQHLMRLNKIRLAVPALQMGQYSTDGCSGGWASFKRRYTGTVGGTAIDSFALVGVGGGNHTYTGVPIGRYVDCVTGAEINCSGGTVSFNVNGGDAGLGVYVLDTAATPAPGKVITASTLLY
jgi:glycosidase